MTPRSGYEFDLLLGPQRSERRAWMVAAGASGIALVLGAVLVAMLPLKSTEVVTVLVDRHTGDMEKIVKVEPTGIEDEEAVKQALLVSYITDREGFLSAGADARMQSVLRRTTGAARPALISLWTPGADNKDYPPSVYGPGAEVDVMVKRITFLEKSVAQVRFEKTLRRPNQDPVTQAFVATVQFAFTPKRERSLALVWENPLGFEVTAYRVDAETVGASSGGLN